MVVPSKPRSAKSLNAACSIAAWDVTSGRPARVRRTETDMASNLLPPGSSSIMALRAFIVVPITPDERIRDERHQPPAADDLDRRGARHRGPHRGGLH